MKPTARKNDNYKNTSLKGEPAPLPVAREHLLFQFFSFSGKIDAETYISRFKYLWIPGLILMLLTHLLSSIIFDVVLEVSGNADAKVQNATIVLSGIFIVLILSILSYWSLMVRRLRDLELSPFWSILLLILWGMAFPDLSFLPMVLNSTISFILIFIVWGFNMYLWLGNSADRVYHRANHIPKRINGVVVDENDGPFAFNILFSVVVAIGGSIVLALFYLSLVNIRQTLTLLFT